jgi:hypothetical protein
MPRPHWSGHNAQEHAKMCLIIKLCPADSRRAEPKISGKYLI